ncbi:MAG: putative transporter [Pirellulales bacterium]|nr:putative transporter [Pirellulales bacterium]
MKWIFELYQTNPTAQAIAILSLVCVAGMSLGSVQIRGIKLGTSGVLFAAIVAGHFTKAIDHHTLEFVKEFGLILFVFCIGLQLGPGFFASLREAGFRLNTLALAIVSLGAITVVLLGWLLGLDRAAALGVFSGATTNTPSLGAAQQTLTTFPHVTAERAALPALAYAVTYPLGIVGIIGTLLALKAIFKVDVRQERDAYLSAQQGGHVALQQRSLIIENPNIEGIAIHDVPGLAESGVVISRIQHSGEPEAKAAAGGIVLRTGDSVLAVGSTHGLDQLERVLGRESDAELLMTTSQVVPERIVVTNSAILGQSVKELNLESLFGVVVTRVVRGDLELTAVPTLRLKFGDVLQVVGPPDSLQLAAAHLGNSVHALNETHFVPLFAGISLGVVLGTMPIAFPGLPQPLRLGLAGGPLIVALIVGRVGRIGRLVWHLPRSASLALRELGIALFFAAVGLMAGPTFFDTAFSQTGILWMVAGACTTILPLVAVGTFARVRYSMNYVVLAGLLAGSMTDPPALAFANSVCQSEAPGVAYATVYPLTMLLRIMAAQVLAVVLCG